MIGKILIIDDEEQLRKLLVRIIGLLEKMKKILVGLVLLTNIQLIAQDTTSNPQTSNPLSFSWLCRSLL